VPGKKFSQLAISCTDGNPGNHELYVADVAYDTFNQFSKYWGEKYLTSNVQILNPSTGAWDYIGQKYRYFTTPKGLRIMSFGVLFDFTGNANNSRVIKAADMIKQDWFLSAVNFDKPIDLFLVIGHNIARPSTKGSTFGPVHDAIRAAHPKTPIQIFGGHSHIRDFAVLDDSSTALEAGRYCETLGWLSMSGFDDKNSGWKGVTNPRGVANPTRHAVNGSTSPWVYSRRYLDWNRATFTYHAAVGNDFDLHSGQRVTKEITDIRTQQRLGDVYGCVPADYCMTCVAFGDPHSIFVPIMEAMSTVVVNPARTVPRMVVGDTGGVRFDMYKGAFTRDDTFVIMPFRDVWLYFPEVPYSLAKGMLAK
jgi:hypothetical protein